MSLLRPHPLWTTCKANSFEVNKSVAVARLLSGRYNSDWHSRHWSPANEEGYCLLCPGKNIPGTIEHLLLSCEALKTKRSTLFNFWEENSEDSLPLQDLLLTIRRSSAKDFVQFVLDPSVVQSVITGCQKKLFQLDEIFHLTRTYAYGIHRRRLQLLGRLNLIYS